MIFILTDVIRAGYDERRTQVQDTEMIEAIAKYFNDNFEPSNVVELQRFVGKVKNGTRKVMHVPVFYVEHDFDIESYKEICREVRRLGFSGKYYVFSKGVALIQSPNIMFRRVSNDELRILDYSEIA